MRRVTLTPVSSADMHAWHAWHRVVESTEEDSRLRACLQVLTHVAERLKDLHAAGYVHRDIKPGNIMWLPRKNRWTLIDFGCAAKVGEDAHLSFSLTYVPPEVLASHCGGERSIVAAEAMDTWSVGILALEMFSGKKVFGYNKNKRQVPLSRCSSLACVSTTSRRILCHACWACTVPFC